MTMAWKRMTALLATVGLAASATALQPGMPAPPFTALDQHGATVNLADFRGKSNVVLYFYPKDGTPGCTAEACSLRDGYQDILATGAVVLGVSADDVASHAAFATKYDLPFSILADPDAKLINSYGVKLPVLKLASRVTFIIDRSGTIRAVVEKVDPAVHDRQVLALLHPLS